MYENTYVTLNLTIPDKQIKQKHYKFVLHNDMFLNNEHTYTCDAGQHLLITLIKMVGVEYSKLKVNQLHLLLWQHTVYDKN